MKDLEPLLSKQSDTGTDKMVAVIGVRLLLGNDRVELLTHTVD